MTQTQPTYSTLWPKWEQSHRHKITRGLLTNLKWNSYIPHKPTTRQLAFLLLNNEREILFGGAAGGGKLLKEGGVILTPFGWKKCGELKVGDRVNAPDGTTSQIIQLHPWVEVQGVCVEFHDGTKTEVAWDHLWLAWRSGKKKKLPNSSNCCGERSAQVVETRQLYKWVQQAKKQEREGERPNHPLIPVCQPQVFNVQSPYPIQLDPYKLGVWLGDGCCSAKRVKITSGDMGYLRGVFTDDNYSISGIDLCLKGDTNKHWVQELTRAGLVNSKAHSKFIPRQYLFNSIENRWALLQGLMDTDGTVDERGQLYYCTISDRLKNDIIHLVQSLGGTATPRIKPTDCQPAWDIYIKFRDEQNAFRLPRKKERCNVNGSLMYKRIVDIYPTKIIRGRCLTVSHPTGLYLTNDFIVTHNSDALLMALLQYVDYPEYKGLYLMRTTKDFSRPSAPFSRIKEWLGDTDAKIGEQQKQITFPSGAVIEFGHIEHENNKYDYKSAEYHCICFDELTQFTEGMYTYLFSRNRKPENSTIPLRMRTASNPDGKGFEWVKARFITGKKMFISSKLQDNPHLDQEGYIDSLSELDAVTRARLLEGDWDVMPSGDKFKREWFNLVEQEPHKSEFVQVVRFWDKASTEPGKGKDPDHTAGVKVGITKDGLYYILDVARDRLSPLGNEKLVYNTAVMDGREIKIGIEQEGGASGKSDIDHYIRNVVPEFMCNGYRSTGSKEIRAGLPSSKAQAGIVYVLNRHWTSDYINELVSFPKGAHDDQVDATSGAFLMINENKDSYYEEIEPVEEGVFEF